jgi:cysteine desulfurase
MIFLDYNATAPIRDSAKDAFNEILYLPYNASSVHSFGRKGKSYLNKARKSIEKDLSAEGASIIFCASGTEANNMALNSLNVDKIITTSIEHASIKKPAEKLSAIFLKVDNQGKIDLSNLEQKISDLSKKKQTFLLSIILANNETGVIQDIEKISPLIFQNAGYLHLDASQAVGKIKVDFNHLKCDMMTISGHKVGAGFGSAALIVKKGLEISPLLLGGGQEKYLRGGTENLPSIHAFSKAINEVCSNLKEEYSRVLDLREYLENNLKKTDKNLIVFSDQVDRLPNTTCFYSPVMTAETQLISFDLAKIAVSSGSACSSGRVSKSHVIQAMGYSEQVASNSIRVSLGWGNTKEEIDKFLKVFSGFFSKTT